MALTSINVQPAKVGAEQHDRRTKHLDYVRQDLSSRNQIWEAPNFGSVSQAIAEARRIVKDKTGRSMQAKATPIREGVAVISESTSMEQLQEFCRRCEDKWGIKALAIYTHMDEGHDIDGVWHGNLHAHIIWQWYNSDTGKSIRNIKAQDMSEMQTILADCLQMERGKASSKQHLNAIEYKVKEMEKQRKGLAAKIDKLQGMVAELESKLKDREDKNRQYKARTVLIKTEIKALGLFKAISEGLLHIVGQSKADKEIMALRAKNDELGARLTEASASIVKMQERHEQQLAETKEAIAQRIYQAMGHVHVRHPVLDNALNQVRELQQTYDRDVNERFDNYMDSIKRNNGQDREIARRI